VLVTDFLPEEIRAGQKPKKSAQGEGNLPSSDLRGFLDERLRSQSNDIYAESLELMERYVVTRILHLTSGNQSKAAQMLGITRGSLRNKIHSLGISIGQVVHFDDENVPEMEEAVQ